VASRLAGSSDIYQWTHRGAYASINFVTAHDGFTLHDLVSYERKHNEANGENNRDGHDDNVSRNWGVEGETDDEDILDLRFRSMKNFLATLAFSQGVPMIAHGDEIARTQRGNNNAYCQDNELTWMDWGLDERRQELLEFTRRVIAIRQSNAVLRRRHFFQGQSVGDTGIKDVTWLRPDAAEMTESDWRDPGNHALGMLIDGDATDETDARGRPSKGDTLLLLFNGGDAPVPFCLPPQERKGQWTMLVNTVLNTAARESHGVVAGEGVTLHPHSLVLLRYGRERRSMADSPTSTRAGQALPTEAHA
ncbi:MAG: glycogen debranching enzyme, partial [Gemmatimonadaceae bacterium]